jgi:hypothetical protein
MPETTVHKHRGPVPREDGIGLSGKTTAIDSKAISKPVQQGANSKLGSGVPPPNAGHVPTAFLFGEIVHFKF